MWNDVVVYLFRNNITAKGISHLHAGKSNMNITQQNNTMKMFNKNVKLQCSRYDMLLLWDDSHSRQCVSWSMVM